MAENRVRMVRTSSSAVFNVVWVCGFVCLWFFLFVSLFRVVLPSFLAQSLAALALCQGNEGFY